MKKLFTILFAVAALAACTSSEDKELEAFLSKQDTHWTELQSDFDKPLPDRPGAYRGANKKGYYNSPLMGNGLLGSMFYRAEEPNTYRINVGRVDVTEQRESRDVMYEKSRLPIGYFTLATVGNVTGESMDLSLYNALTTGTLTTDKGSIGFSTYVHALEDYIVLETESTGDEAEYRWEFVPFKAIGPRTYSNPRYPKTYLNREGKSNPDAYRADRGDLHCLVQPLARDTTFTDIAKYYAVAWKEVAKGSVRRIIATISLEKTEQEAVDKAEALIDKGLAASSKSLLKTHEQWWHDYYRNLAFLTFPDPKIERYYWMQYYKFACVTRPDKFIVDLQGPWATWDTPWAAIWTNLNIQFTYSFLTKSNMGEFAMPMWDTFWKFRDNLKRNVTDVAGQEDWTDSACLERTCSYDLYHPLEPSEANKNNYEVGNLAWALFYWYQQCLAYGDEKDMKERLFPLLKSAVNLFLHIRIEHPDGTYSLPPTASPEYPVPNVGPNTNYDLANLRQALTELIDIDNRFSIGDPQLPVWKDFLENMPDFPYSETTGYKVSDTQEFLLNTHRPYSHLFMIYPYHMLDWNDPVQRDRARLSIDHWQGDEGYSRTGKAAMLASEGEGDEALEQFNVFIDKFLMDNTLYVEAGPCIETPFAGASTLHEFYLQDWGDRLRVFYGCPSSWKDVTFRGMRAIGAFLVDAERKDGKTAEVKVHSEKGGVCRVQTDILPDRISVKCAGKSVDYKLLDCPELRGNGSLVEFSTEPGSTTEIFAAL